MKTHSYDVRVAWTGNTGVGTAGYADYRRDTVTTAGDKDGLLGSSDPDFRGDPARWNPEELLVAALSQCHMLSYLHSAATNGIVVESYVDAATGTMEQAGDGGRFTSVTLRPVITISSGDLALADELHREASANCFIASSVNFPVLHEPDISRV